LLICTSHVFEALPVFSFPFSGFTASVGQARASVNLYAGQPKINHAAITGKKHSSVLLFNASL